MINSGNLSAEADQAQSYVAGWLSGLSPRVRYPVSQ